MMNEDPEKFLESVARMESCEGSEPIMAVTREHLSVYASIRGISLRMAEIQALSMGYVPRPYLRNFREMDTAEQIRLLDSRVALVGLGGLGGHILELLARLGVGRIRAADGDSFEECNLNRQLLCTTDTLNLPKSYAATRRAAMINPAVQLSAFPLMLDRAGFQELLTGVDLAFDALGGIEAKRMLLSCARDMSVPLVTGSVAGWTAFVTLVEPGDEGPEMLWQGGAGAEERLGCLGPAIGLAASVQCSEGVKYLCSGKSSLSGRILAVDLRSADFEILSLHED